MSTAHAIRKVLALPTPTPALESDVRFYNDKFYVCDGAAWNEVSLGGAGGGATPKVYRALLTQTDTNNPTAVVLENSLGGEVVWTRFGLGSYYGTLAGAFSNLKTHILAMPQAAPSTGPFAVSGSGGDFTGAGNDKVTLYFFDDAWNSLDGCSNLSVQILVYP